jgi:LysM repeat protein
MTITIPASLEAPSPAILESSDPRASTGYVPVSLHGKPRSLAAQSVADGRIAVTVHRGETLAAIADRYHVSVADISHWNHLKTTRVRRGTRLKIRTGDAASDRGAPSTGVTPIDAATTAASADAGNARDEKSNDAKNSAGTSATSGDASHDAGDAARGAAEHQDAESADRSAGDDEARPAVPSRHAAKGHAAHKNSAGRKPASRASATHRPSSAHARTVVVRAGDTLGGIAGRNGISIVELRRMNGLKSNRVHAGQRLRIPQG